MNHFKIIYPKGIRLILKNRTFKEAMEIVWKSNIANHTQPLKLVITSTGEMLYMCENSFNAFLSGDLSMEELISLTKTDELYRNRVEIVFGTEMIIDPGSLWKCNQESLTLIDEDCNITHKLDLEIFEIAEPNL